MPAGVLDVVRARRGGGAARGQRGGTALVRPESPATGRGLIDRPAHERVAEAEAPRHVGVANEVAAQQLVQCVHRRRLGHARRGGRQLRLEGIARDRRALEDAARAGRQDGQLLRQRRRHRARHLHARERDLRGRRLAGGTRRASARAVRGRTGCRRSARRAPRPPPGLTSAPSSSRASSRLSAPSSRRRQRARAMGPLERGRQPLGHLPRTQRNDQHHRRVGRAPQQRAEQIERPGVGPVQVVEQQHERLPSPPASPAAGRTRGACGSDRPATARRPPAATGTPARARRTPRSPSSSIRRGSSALDVLVQRVHEEPERQLALELRRAAREHQPAAPVGAARQLGEQPRLADPRLALELERSRAVPARARRATAPGNRAPRRARRSARRPRPLRSVGRA